MISRYAGDMATGRGQGMTTGPEERSGADSTWAAIAEGVGQTPQNVVYEVTFETDDEVRTETVTAWMYNTNFGEHSLVTFWDQERPVASFNTRYVRQIRIVHDTT